MAATTPPTEEQIRGVTGAENLLINADMTTRWNADPDYFPGYLRNGAI